MRRIALVVFSSALSFALLLPTGGAGATGRPAPAAEAVPRVLSCLAVPEVRPANYLMSCADANASWKKVRWANWGPKTALGTGDLYQNDCQPNCVSGRFHTYAAKVVLSGGDRDQEVRPALLQGHVLLLGERQARERDVRARDLTRGASVRRREAPASAVHSQQEGPSALGERSRQKLRCNQR